MDFFCTFARKTCNKYNKYAKSNHPPAGGGDVDRLK